MKLKLIKADGTECNIMPKNGKKLQLEEMQKLVGGLIEYIGLPSGAQMIINEEGKLIGLPINEKATEIFKQEYPIEKYPLNNDELVVGDVILMERGK